MKMFNYQTKIPIIKETEVLVIGGGPAGIAAAIAAAREGAKTLLIEKMGSLGGMATVGLVGPFMTSFDKSGELQIIRGIFDELIIRLEEIGGAIHPSKIRAGSSYSGFITTGHDHVTPFDSEKMKLVAAQMVQESGAKILLHTGFIDVIKQDDRISGAVVATKSGLAIIKSDFFIDCTGDADVASQAEAPYTLGNKQSNEMQPATMFLKISNVKSEVVKGYIEENIDLMGKLFHGPFNWLVKDARKKGEWNIERGEIGMYETSNSGEWRINTTRITNVDGTKSEDLTRAEIEGREQAMKLFEFLKANIPGYENAKLMQMAEVIGIRETRHIIGEYIITKEDVIQGRIFKDKIMLASNSVDIHHGDNGGEYLEVQNGNWYSIPYRSLVPLGVSNLLIAGRSISATADASSAFRVMPCCMGTGQASGVAAATAVKLNLKSRDININDLHKKLIEQNVFLDN